MRLPITLKPNDIAAIVLATAISIPAWADGWTLQGLTNGLRGGVTGSGKLQTENRNVSAFDAIDLRDSNDLEVRFGAAQAVTVEADDNILPLIATSVDRGTLIIKSTGSFHTRLSPKIVVTLPSLSRLSINGSGDAHLSHIAANGLTLAISGSGDIKADGQVDDIDLKINGSGDADLAALQAKSITVALNGSGDASLNVTDSLNAVVNGSGDIRYSGNPVKVSSRVHGSGEISRR